MTSEPVEISENQILSNRSLGSPFNWINWCLTSQTALQHAEARILENLQTPYKTRYVNIGPVIGDEDINIWTLSMNENECGAPLVLIHGLCSGLALWSLNFDELARSSNRPIHAIDLPGFGRSSRPPFSNDTEDAKQVETQLVKMIDTWRSRMNLERIILLGHSFGAYLSFSYSLTYPERIVHLILADPWGFNKKPGDLADIERIPFHHRMVAKLMAYLRLNPMGPIRLLGHFGGPVVIQLLRGKDLITHFKNFMDKPLEKMVNYIFHANCQNPTGECAFNAMASTYGWAQNPMYLRIHSLDQNIPLTLIYGSKSWIDHYAAEKIAEDRSPAYVDYHKLNSSHHVYAATAMEFNEIVLKVCSRSEDSRRPT